VLDQLARLHHDELGHRGDSVVWQAVHGD
jgi:hypothetical protein